MEEGGEIKFDMIHPLVNRELIQMREIAKGGYLVVPDTPAPRGFLASASPLISSASGRSETPPRSSIHLLSGGGSFFGAGDGAGARIPVMAS